MGVQQADGAKRVTAVAVECWQQDRSQRERKATLRSANLERVL